MLLGLLGKYDINQALERGVTSEAARNNPLPGPCIADISSLLLQLVTQLQHKKLLTPGIHVHFSVVQVGAS